MNTVARFNIEEMLAEARRGEANCLGKLLQYYGNYLKLLVTTHLDAKLRDALQSVGHRAGELLRGPSRLREVPGPNGGGIPGLAADDFGQ